MKLIVITPEGKALSHEGISVWEVLARLAYLRDHEPEAVWRVEA